jgi:anti-sigma-K factor RskA
MRIPNGRRARKTESGASAENTRPLGATWRTASRWRAPVVFSALAAGAALAAPAVASASPLPSPVAGHVYLDDNTAGSNTIAVFDRHADGSLTSLPGSPFAAGGAGTGAGPGVRGRRADRLPAGATPAGIAVS